MRCHLPVSLKYPWIPGLISQEACANQSISGDDACTAVDFNYDHRCYFHRTNAQELNVQVTTVEGSNVHYVKTSCGENMTHFINIFLNSIFMVSGENSRPVCFAQLHERSKKSWCHHPQTPSPTLPTDIVKIWFLDSSAKVGKLMSSPPS